jgi:hypothetical protein
MQDATKTAPECEPCEIPAFCRSNYYKGKLLTERELSAEQRYFIDKMRLHYVALHGWGVVCGLMVRPHPQCLDRVVIAQGFGVDECGREIRVVEDVVVMLPEEPEPPPPPCPPEPCDDDEPEEPCEPEPRTYYICIRYKECPDEYVTTPFDECCAPSKKPNRICEGFEVEVVTEPPDCLERAHERRHCDEDDCERLYHSLPEHCPPAPKECCIPLAVISIHRPGKPLTGEMIDNRIRPVVPSSRLLEELIHCILHKLPKAHPHYTHITRINWRHDHEYATQECMRQHVGSHEAPMGFEVEFSARVHPKGLNTRTFQAMVVREPAEPREMRHVEYAPARVMRSEDGLRCILQIDPEYARRHLQDHDFDLFITLKCDKVVDDRGLPVDGVLRARMVGEEDRDYHVAPPTGRGSGGGTFESWIRVRRRR